MHQHIDELPWWLLIMLEEKTNSYFIDHILWIKIELKIVINIYNLNLYYNTLFNNLKYFFSHNT